MTDGGTPRDLLSLPRGGGALTGLGETFDADIQMGTGNLAVPIEVPDGRGGFGSRLSLRYSTGNGNGPFGLGWELPLPGIARRTSRGIPRYDTSDLFLLSAREELVEVPGGAADSIRYRPSAEGSFFRIERHVATEDYWEVFSQDGTRTRFGTAAAAIPAGGVDPATIAARPGATFAWRPALTTDQFGNRIEYRYRRDPGAPAGDPGSGQLLLDEIAYADYGTPPNVQFLVVVRFVYEERPDPITESAAGFALRTTQRCIRIEIVTGPGATEPSRVYHLRYVAPGTDGAPRNGASMLGEIQAEGRDGQAVQLLPPLSLGYTRFEPERRDLVAVRGAALPLDSFGRPGYALADASGNGLPDLVSIDGRVRIWENVGGGTFGLPRDVVGAPAGLSLADGSAELLDADGDGRLDVLVAAPLAGYYPLRFDERWDPHSFRRYVAPPSFSARDPLVRLVDLDRDGATDAVRTGDRLECYFATRAGAWRKERALPRRGLAEFPDVRFDDPRVRLADMAGDGGRAFVLVHPGRVDYWPMRGRGEWDARVTMTNGPDLPIDWEPRRMLLGDVDGDGTADLVYVEPGRVRLWLNQGGRSWSDPIEIAGTPPVHEAVSVQLVDLMGSGTSGVLWSSDRPADRETTFFLDFTGGTKPYLLERVDNHRGALSRVAYASSTSAYLADAAAPERRWRTSLPFPVQVVSRVETVDLLANRKRTTEYAYHHGHWDGATREFRGFGRVDRRETDAPASTSSGAIPAQPDPTFAPSLETRTWFHLGDVADPSGGAVELDCTSEFWMDDPPALARPPATTTLLAGLPVEARRRSLRTLRGRIVRAERYGLDGGSREGRPYEVTEHSFGIASLPVGQAPADPAEDWQLAVFFPYLAAERTTTWERGSEPLTTLRFHGSHDGYGHARSRLDVGVPRGREYRTALAATLAHEPYLATRTVSSYAVRDDPSGYLVDRVASVTVTRLDLARFEAAQAVSPAAADLDAAVESGQVDEEIVTQSVSFFDGDGYTGLPFGEVGTFGTVTRQEKLVLPDDIASRAYREPDGTDGRPPYLSVTAALPPAAYPAEFLSAMPALAGFVARSGAPYAGGLYAAAERRKFDFHDPAAEVRGLLTGSLDPLGNETAIAADPYRLMPATVTDPAGLQSTATIDYRVLKPAVLTDPNGNRTSFGYTPWGLVQTIGRSGTSTETVGDTPAAPGTTFDYDFDAFASRGEPTSVRTTKRVHHATETWVAEPARSETIEQRDYCDGFGRVIQTRTLAAERGLGDPTRGDAGLSADPSLPAGSATSSPASAGADRTLIASWRRFDSNGRVVERIEPSFTTGWTYAPPAAGLRRTRLVHDAAGRLIRTIAPDGAEKLVVHGVPGTIASPDASDPDVYEPTPWEVYLYGPNDNAGRTHPLDPRTSRLEVHRNTPSSSLRDAFGRTVASVERCRSKLAGGTFSAIEELRTEYDYDAAGRLVEARDPLGRVAARNTYALDGTLVRAERLDSGVRLFAPDAGGDIVEARDDRGAVVLRAYDGLRRLTRLWARDEGSEALTLRERLEYGDAGSRLQPDADREANRALNRLGHLAEHHDEAGLLRHAGYDHRGNAVEIERRVIRDERFEDVFTAAAGDGWRVVPFRTDWTVAAGSTLAARETELLADVAYGTESVLDALDRATAITGPAADGSTGARSVTRIGYDRAGRVSSIDVDGRSVVEDAFYDARGKPLLVTQPAAPGGAGFMRRSVYDELSGRLVRIRSEPFVHPGGDVSTWQPAGSGPAQDLLLESDLAGSVLASSDRAAATPLDRAFDYDSLSRLVSESGHECPTQPVDPWFDDARCVTGGPYSQYTEQLAYDAAGNVTQIRHDASGAVALTDLALAAGSNRLASVTAAGATYAYEYDAAGNLTSEATSRHLEWDAAGRLRVFRQQTAAGGPAAGPDDLAEPSLYAHYLYDAAGKRALKVLRRQGGALEVSMTIGEGFEHRRWREGPTPRQAATVRMSLDGAPIWSDRRGDARAGDSSPATQVHLTDNLGSCTVTLDGSYAIVDREDFTAFGRTAFGGAFRKRFRFAGKERDEESGLGFFGARFYAPWLARWVSCDPAAAVEELDPYVYARNNPASRCDRDGRQSRRADADSAGPQAGDTFDEAEPDESWALPSYPKHPVAVEPDEDEKPRSLGQVLLDFLFKGSDTESDRKRKPLTPPPDPPPVIADDIYSDDGTSYVIEGDDYKHWPRIYRRVEIGPDKLSIESSSDLGRTWTPTGNTVTVFSGPVLTDEERAQRDADEAADSQRAGRIGSLIVGLVVGALNFAFIVLALSLIPGGGGIVSRIFPWGLLASIAVGGAVGYGMGVASQLEPSETAEPAADVGNYTMQL